jgi:Mor family transcriptional regulator
VSQNKAKAESVSPVAIADLDAEVAYLAKRHRVSTAIIREIIRRAGSSERSVVERELQKGKARR